MREILYARGEPSRITVSEGKDRVPEVLPFSMDLDEKPERKKRLRNSEAFAPRRTGRERPTR